MTLRRPRHRFTNNVALLIVVATTLVGCTADAADDQSSGRFATAELERAIQGLVADNGLISVSPVSGEKTVDLLATSVLHRSGAAALPSPSKGDITDMCRRYGDAVPPLQVSGELRTIVSDDDFVSAAADAECITLDAPQFEVGKSQDAQQFLLSAATWVGLPGVDHAELDVSQVQAAVSELPEMESTSPWSHWTCETVALAMEEAQLCSALPPAQEVTQLTTTEELMNLRAAVELSQRAESSTVDPELLEQVPLIPVQDALDAEQVQRISELEDLPTENLQAWLDDQTSLVGDKGFVEADVQILGTLQGTYAAARVLEDRTRNIIDEKSRQSMDEVIVLAERTSPADGTVARLMRAAVLEAAGDLSEADRTVAMEGYSGIAGTPCPTDKTELCVLAADAAFRLDDQAGQIVIPVPDTLPEGDATDELMYRVLAHSWAVENVDDWVIAAQDRGLDPLRDVSDKSLPSSVRLWAAAARSVLYPELDTEAETRVVKSVDSLVSCQDVDGLAVGDGPGQSCSVDSTLAYYLSGVWGM
jgi:hypothetical protein